MRRSIFTAASPAGDPVALEVNARIRAQAQRFEIGPDTPLNFMCECGCMTELSMTASGYDGVRGAILAPGHRLREPSVIARVADGVRLRRKSAWRHATAAANATRTSTRKPARPV